MTINKLECGVSTGSQLVASVNGLIDVSAISATIKNPATIDADPSIATITTDTSQTAGLNTLYTYLTNTDTIKASANLGVEDFFNQVRLKTCTEVSGFGNIADLDGEGASQVYASYTVRTDAPDISFRSAGGTQCTIKIDGVYPDKSNYTLPSGGITYLNISFGSRKPRTIEFQIKNSAVAFSGIYLSNLDTLFKPPSKPKAIVFGDSFGTGSYDQDAGIGWPIILGDSLGYDCCPSARGGTGFLSTGGGSYNYLGRAGDAAILGADAVFASSSINDAAFGNQQDVADNVTAWHAQVRADLPSAPIYVIGSPGNSSSSGHIAGEQTVKDAIELINDDNLFFISVMTDDNPPISGSGNIGTPTGDGNADVYISADNVHFTQAGHIFWTDWVVNKIISTL